MQQAKSACKRKGLVQDYDDAIEVESEAVDNAKNFREAIANATGPKSKKDTKDPNQPLLDELKASLKEALLVHKEAQEAQAMAAEGFFSLYANLLNEDAQFHWDKIISSQVGAAPWTNLKRKEHKKERDKSMESFQDCITFHLLDMFPGDAAKQQCYYISNVLKKPQRVPVRYFFNE